LPDWSKLLVGQVVSLLFVGSETPETSWQSVAKKPLQIELNRMVQQTKTRKWTLYAQLCFRCDLKLDALPLPLSVSPFFLSLQQRAATISVCVCLCIGVVVANANLFKVY